MITRFNRPKFLGYRSNHRVAKLTKSHNYVTGLRLELVKPDSKHPINIKDSNQLPHRETLSSSLVSKCIGPWLHVQQSKQSEFKVNRNVNVYCSPTLDFGKTCTTRRRSTVAQMFTWVHLLMGKWLFETVLVNNQRLPTQKQSSARFTNWIFHQAVVFCSCATHNLGHLAHSQVHVNRLLVLSNLRIQISSTRVTLRRTTAYLHNTLHHPSNMYEVSARPWKNIPK